MFERAAIRLNFRVQMAELTENEIIALRRARLEQLQASGNDPFAQTRFERTHRAAQILADYPALDGADVRVAGRIKTKRGQGKISFADLYDPTGKIQIVAQLDRLGEEKMTQWLGLELGDIVGVSGQVFQTKRGETSVAALDFVLLATAIQPMPDKYHGLQDVETRYRQRYADLIANEEVVELFKKRSAITREMRRFLDERGFMEVETPMMQPIAGGAAARPFVTHHNALDMPLYLRIAPELYLKRLVVGGLERVYEINRNFRNEGVDTSHNPEFTMMECYQAFADYHDMMDLTEAMVQTIAGKVNGGTIINYDGHEIDLGQGWKRATMQELVREKIGLDLSGHALIEAFEEHVEEGLIAPTFVMDFPVENSPLAKMKTDDPRFTYRFELFIGGSEIGNAFSELNDPLDQAERFKSQMKARAKGDDEAQAYDTDYLRALQYGLAPSGGLGIGIDRLTMLLTGQNSIREVILFPLLKPELGAVESSAIEAEKYDAEKKILYIKWKSGPIYAYYGIGPKVYREFENAESRGAFFEWRDQREIRGRETVLNFTQRRRDAERTKKLSIDRTLSFEIFSFFVLSASLRLCVKFKSYCTATLVLSKKLWRNFWKVAQSSAPQVLSWPSNASTGNSSPLKRSKGK